jgi:hypothetical protein
MKPTLLVILLVLVTGCGPKTSSTVKIHGVRQGLARESNGKWTIYEEGDHLAYQVNGQCVADGKTVPCMWYAVAFEYEADGDVTPLTCKSKLSRPTDIVTPKETVARQATEVAGAVELRGRSGKMVWPGYSTGDDPAAITTTTDCTLNGKSVLNYSTTITE